LINSTPVHSLGAKRRVRPRAPLLTAISVAILSGLGTAVKEVQRNRSLPSR